MTGRRRLLLVCTLIILALAYHPLKWNLFPSGGPPMDTAHWKTRCVGRFLIDIPPTARMLEEKGDYGEIWGHPLVWRKDLTPETARREALAEAEKWKTVKHKKVPGNMFLDTVELPHGGIAIVRWEEYYSDIFQTFQCYFITPGPDARVFTFYHGYSTELRALAQKDVEHLALSLRARDDDEIPTEPGFCFPGGFSSHSGEWRSERAGIAFELPEFPGITICLYLWLLGIHDELSFTKNTVEAFARSVHPDTRILRCRKLMLGEIDAVEVATVTKDSKSADRQRLSFTLRSSSREDRLDWPRVHFTMNNALHWRDARIPFKSDAEALSLWDALVRSIRLRPGAV